jgi:hypothetical protein
MSFRNVSLRCGAVSSLALAPILASCNPSPGPDRTSSATPSAANGQASAAAHGGPARWKRFTQSSAIVNSKSEPPVPLSVLEPKFVAALRSELTDASIESADGKVAISRAGQTIEISTKALAWQCPAGEGAACDAAIREVARTTGRDVVDPPSCAGKPFEPELLMEDDSGDGVLSARIAGRLHVGVAAYMENRAVRAWCSAAEAPALSPERVLSWAREQVAARPPPPIAPRPEHDGIWMIIEKSEVAVYFLDGDRLLAAIKNPKGPLVAVVPTVNMVIFTTADREDLVADLRVTAKAYANKPGTRGLSDEVYEWREGKWQVLPAGE